MPKLVLLVAVWVDPAASDERAVRAANRGDPTAIADAVSPPTAEDVAALVERREEARNAYFGGVG